MLSATVMARLMCDVDMAEEAELWRLEHGSPRLPSCLTGAMAWGGVLPEPTVAAQMEVEAADASKRKKEKSAPKSARKAHAAIC